LLIVALQGGSKPISQIAVFCSQVAAVILVEVTDVLKQLVAFSFRIEK